MPSIADGFYQYNGGCLIPHAWITNASYRTWPMFGSIKSISHHAPDSNNRNQYYYGVLRGVEYLQPYNDINYFGGNQTFHFSSDGANAPNSIWTHNSTTHKKADSHKIWIGVNNYATHTLMTNFQG